MRGLKRQEISWGVSEFFLWGAAAEAGVEFGITVRLIRRDIAAAVSFTRAVGLNYICKALERVVGWMEVDVGLKIGRILRECDLSKD